MEGAVSNKHTSVQQEKKKKNPRAAWEREPTAKAHSGACAEGPVPDCQQKVIGTASHATLILGSLASFLFALLSTDL